jgi:hypothetical protein
LLSFFKDARRRVAGLLAEVDDRAGGAVATRQQREQ